LTKSQVAVNTGAGPLEVEMKPTASADKRPAMTTAEHTKIAKSLALANNPNHASLGFANRSFSRLALLAFLAMALALPTAGMTLATIIAAITNATVRTKNMRLTI
jgi:hypothetical protein